MSYCRSQTCASIEAGPKQAHLSHFQTDWLNNRALITNPTEWDTAHIELNCNCSTHNAIARENKCFQGVYWGTDSRILKTGAYRHQSQNLQLKLPPPSHSRCLDLVKSGYINGLHKIFESSDALLKNIRSALQERHYLEECGQGNYQ